MSDLYKVFTRELDLAQRRVLFEVHSANHDEQEVPQEAAFYANVIADLFVSQQIEIMAPGGYLDIEPPTQATSAGVEWFWLYALEYSQDQREHILNTHRKLNGPELHLFFDAWFEAQIGVIEEHCHQMIITHDKIWRDDYNAQCGLVTVEVHDPLLIQHILPGAKIGVVYDDAPLWDCL